MNTVEKKTAADAMVDQILNAGISPDQTFASGVVQQEAIGSRILTGPAIVISAAQRNVLIDLLSALGSDGELDKSAVLLAMMNSVYQTLKTVAKNLAPSEKEKELRQRKKEELEKLRRELENRQITLEKAAIRFSEVILDPVDRRMLEDNLAKQRPVMA